MFLTMNKGPRSKREEEQVQIYMDYMLAFEVDFQPWSVSQNKAS